MNIEDTGWINGTLNTGIILSSNSGFQYGNGIQARIINGVLFVRVSVSKSTGYFAAADKEVTIGSLPNITGYDLKTLLKGKNYIRAGAFGTETSQGFLQVADGNVTVRIINGNAYWLTGILSIPLN
jgi:hypothetical protein